MRIRDENKKAGHLLAFTSQKDNEDNFSIFFAIEGLEQFDSLVKVVKGMTECAENLNETYRFDEYSIGDIGQVENVFPEIDRSRLYRFDLDEFLDEESRFISGFCEIEFERLKQKGSPVFPDITTGAMATGPNFYDRREVIERIWNKAGEGKNLLLRAPRRYGKSSLLDHISKNPRGPWRVCVIDLQGGKSPEDFVEEILKGLMRGPSCSGCLPEELRELEVWKQNESRKMELLRAERRAIGRDWKRYAEALFRAMGSAEEPFLLILDEVSFLLEDMIGLHDRPLDRVRDLMSWFRSIRTNSPHVSFILSGSEHLPSFLESFGIVGFLDDLETVHLDLFTIETGREFIFMTLAGKKIVAGSAEIKEITDLMGEPIPYFLQLFLDAIVRKIRERKDSALHGLKEIYYETLLGPESKRYFESIYQQLERYGRYVKDGRLGAGKILNELASSDSIGRDGARTIWRETTGDTDRFDLMLNVLKDDFYIREDNVDGSISFSSKLLKEWWQRHSPTG